MEDCVPGCAVDVDAEFGCGETVGKAGSEAGSVRVVVRAVGGVAGCDGGAEAEDVQVFGRHLSVGVVVDEVW